MNLRELREKHDALRKKYPATEKDMKDRVRPRNRRLGELLEVQEAQSELLEAICDKLGVK